MGATESFAAVLRSGFDVIVSFTSFEASPFGPSKPRRQAAAQTLTDDFKFMHVHHATIGDFQRRDHRQRQKRQLQKRLF